VLVARGAEAHGTLAALLEFARAANIPVERVERGWLDERADHHQGVVAIVSPFPYATLDEILESADARGEAPFILMLDMIQDPHNAGALMRTAEAVGVHGVVLPYRGGVAITPAVVAASAGACEHLKVAVGNLARTMAGLREAGVWLVGLDLGPEAMALSEADLEGPLALVIGSEGQGLRRLVREGCDRLVRIPMRGRVASLNASVAGSIALYAAAQARAAGASP
jgi:23S rRNA (guanosine2251-2'-O)-methyltransferase